MIFSDFQNFKISDSNSSWPLMAMSNSMRVSNFIFATNTEHLQPSRAGAEIQAGQVRLRQRRPSTDTTCRSIEAQQQPHSNSCTHNKNQGVGGVRQTLADKSAIGMREFSTCPRRHSKMCSVNSFTSLLQPKAPLPPPPQPPPPLHSPHPTHASSQSIPQPSAIQRARAFACQERGATHQHSAHTCKQPAPSLDMCRVHRIAPHRQP